MQVSAYLLNIFWVEIFIAFILFIPVFDDSKRDFALRISRWSVLPTLRISMYIVAAFLAFICLSSWKELGIPVNGDASLLRQAEAEYDFILAFSILVMGPLLWRYFAVMSNSKRLEKSDIALKRQALQSSKLVETLMDENAQLTESKKRWRLLNFKNKSSLSLDDEDLELHEDEVTGNIRELKRQKKILEKKNNALMQELEETKKSVQNQKLAAIEEASRTSNTYDLLQQELESYKLIAFKSDAS